VVATQVCCRGLRVELRKDLLIADTPEEFVSVVQLNLASGQPWQGLRERVLTNTIADCCDRIVPQHDLVALNNLAAAFVLPSLHEQFELPPLEAMAHADAL
jgi:glycosyltransferase involved in cell wall biosynthesis